MKLTLALIRGGQTKFDKQGLYLGCRDEPMLAESARIIREKAMAQAYPEVELVYTSSYARCVDLAALAYPQIPAIVLKELGAYDFGEYTGKTYHELMGDKRFLSWLREDHLTRLNGGESLYQLTARSAQTFSRIVDELLQKGVERAGIISHRLNLLAMLQRFYVPRSSYREWEMDFGGGFVVEYNSAQANIAIKGGF